MCSVRQRPMPSAPNATAASAWSGWSALVRTLSVRALVRPAHQLGVASGRSATPSASRFFSMRTWMTSRRRRVDAAVDHLAGEAVDRDPVAFLDDDLALRGRHRHLRARGSRSTARRSRRCRPCPSAARPAPRGWSCRRSRSGCRATRSCRGCPPGWSRGGRGSGWSRPWRPAPPPRRRRTRPCRSPRRAGGRPLASSRPSSIAAFLADGRKIGCRSWFSASGSTRRSASSFGISFSSTISTAMRTPAKPVRLPLRVCSMYSLPFSIVNSMSCMSL